MIRVFILFIVAGFLTAACSHHGKRECACHHKKHWHMMEFDKDGNVTKEAFEKAHMEIFKSMDANNDGKVSKEEKKAYHQSQKKDKGKDCGCDKSKKTDAAKDDDKDSA